FQAAMTSPQGPVYHTLSRQPLAAPVDDPIEPAGPQARPAAPSPDAMSIETLAGWIAKAVRPVLITAAACRRAATVEPRGAYAGAWAIPVIPYSSRFMNLPHSHPMHQGYEPAAFLKDADLVIALESEVPWIPVEHALPETCKVAHIGEDPAFVRYPIRSFRSDLSIVSEATNALRALDTAVAKANPDSGKIDTRRRQLTARGNERRAKAAKGVESAGDKITVPYLSQCIADMAGPDAAIFNEYPLSLDHCPREKPGTYFGTSTSGGLGWGLGAA